MTRQKKKSTEKVDGMIDFSIFLTPEAWVSLITLIFLEIVLGVDNLVFIAITTNRLPEEKQHIGRKLGLAGALIMRIIFLSFASILIHMTTPLFYIDVGSLSHGFSIRDLVLLLGGAYLIYKGIVELRDVLRLTEIKAERGSSEHKKIHQLGLGQAIVTIMIMDVVFSIDSVITAVGLAQHLIVMIIAVITAVIFMMVFIDAISDFINKHPEMKILALCFIVVIGILLVLDSVGISSGEENHIVGMPFEKLMVYFAMVFAFILELIQMAFNKNYSTWRKSQWKEETAAQIDSVRKEMIDQIEVEKKASEKAGVSERPSSGFTPVIIGSNVYIMMPVNDEDALSVKEFLISSAGEQKLFDKPIELSGEDVEVEDVSPEEGEVEDGSPDEMEIEDVSPGEEQLPS